MVTRRTIKKETLAVLASMWMLYARGITAKEAVEKALETYDEVMNEIEDYGEQ